MTREETQAKWLMADMTCNVFNSVDMDEAEETLVPRTVQKQKGHLVLCSAKSVVQLICHLAYILVPSRGVLMI